MDREITELADLMKASDYVVVLTGAGMDTESEIPDFRGKKGWWENTDPRTVATVETLERNYERFHQFYTMRLNMLQGKKPHPGHYVLARMERMGGIRSVVTQNVTGLHQLAGSQKVYELHGNILNIRCHRCSHPAEAESFLNRGVCSFCGENALRPGVVLFGESLPREAWDRALEEVERADLLLVIGSSLEVYPVNQLPAMAKGKRVLINNSPRGEEGMFDLTLTGKAGEVLTKLYKTLTGDDL